MKVKDCTHGISADLLHQCDDIVQNGGLVVLPTDTVYGIGAAASDPVAIERLLAAKGRGRSMPPPVLISDESMLNVLCENVPTTARILAHECWPGALTLILQASSDLNWDLGQTGGTIALRVPDHEVTRSVLRSTGPLAVTSANSTGQPPATSVTEAIGTFGENVDLYLDAGDTPGVVPSTIIDCAHSPMRMLRQGVIALETLRNIAGDNIIERF